MRAPAQFNAYPKPLALAVAMAFASLASVPVLANPVAPSVAAGSAVFATLGKTLTVTNSNGAIINWQSFSIGAGETTRFIQSSASSQVLNRITGGDPSQILGSLQSNGRVFLINPNGIAFGKDAQVNVAGLVASTLKLSDADFLANKLNFAVTPGAGKISNEGLITAINGGQVMLVASSVENGGVIQAPNGDIVLAAGKRASLIDLNHPDIEFELAPVDNQLINSGRLQAPGGRIGMLGGLVMHTGEADASSAVAEGGRILLKADGALQSGNLDASGTSGGTINVQVNHHIIQTGSAILQARGSDGAAGTITVQAGLDAGSSDGIFSSAAFDATGKTGGKIAVTGADVTLLAATLNASGMNGGGMVHIGGEWQGSGTLAHAQTVRVNSTTLIKADAIQTGNGGEAVVWSDKKTVFQGTVSARGGATSGNGGRMEVSSKDALIFAGLGDAGAPNGAPGKLLLDPKNIIVAASGSSAQVSAFELIDPNPTASGYFGETILVLPNGNVVVTSPADSLGGSWAGAVYLFNGSTGGLISTLTGSHTSDTIGRASGGTKYVYVTPGGNFLVNSLVWNGSLGAVTWVSGATGLSGQVSSSNSVVGATGRSINLAAVGHGDAVHSMSASYFATNGDYFVLAKDGANNPALVRGQDNPTGRAVGTSGTFTTANSLVCDLNCTSLGLGVIELPVNGNYLWQNAGYYSGWNNGDGAFTWIDKNVGPIGVVNASNSLLLTGHNSLVLYGPGGRILPNGNYLIQTSDSLTWGSGTSGVFGTISSGNSLVSTLGGGVGWFYNTSYTTDGIVVLPNSNYVVNSAAWSVSRGAVTWVDGTTGRVSDYAANGNTNVISSANSLVGSLTTDGVGSYQNYNSGWQNRQGVVVLTKSGDPTYSNYVILSPQWNNNAGAVTWGSGTAGVSGVVSASNSLIGSASGDMVGRGLTRTDWSLGSGSIDIVPGIVRLGNGNYVVFSSQWGTTSFTPSPPWASVGKGAVTWGNGATGTSGVVSSTNSLVGSATTDHVGYYGVVPLSNGNYAVASPDWNSNIGAVTAGNGLGGTTGLISASNSQTGSVSGDRVGVGGIKALTGNGNFVFFSPEWNGGVGAVTLGYGNASAPFVGPISSSNSLTGVGALYPVGNASFFVDQWGVYAGTDGIGLLDNGNYIIKYQNWNGTRGMVAWGSGAINAGAPTLSVGQGHLLGAVSSSNSLIGNSVGDYVGTETRKTGNGNYVVKSTVTSSGGAITWGSKSAGVSGLISSANSLIGTASATLKLLTGGGYLVTNPAWNGNLGAVTWGNPNSGVSGTVSASNSLVGSVAGDRIGLGGVTTLSNGNYVISSYMWNGRRGAITWGDGNLGVTGTISAANSLVGNNLNDSVGTVWALPSGNYLVTSSGAGTPITWGDGTTGTKSTVSAANSLMSAYSVGASGFTTELPNGNALVGEMNAGSTFGRIAILGGGAATLPQTFATNPGLDATLTTSTLTSTLNTGTAVALQANNDITINAAINVNNPSGNGGALTLQAGRSILINANITTDNGALTLSANDLGANASFRDAGVASITMAASTTLNSGTAPLVATLNGSGGTITFYNLVASSINTTGALSSLGTTTLTGALSLTGGNLDLGAGAVMNVGGLATIGAGNSLTIAGGSFNSNGLSLSGGLNLTSGSLATGSTTIANGGTFTLSGGSATFTGPMTVQSGGILSYGLAGTSSIPGASSNAGTMNFTAGTTNFVGGLTQTAGSMTLNGGNVSGSVALNGGFLGGTGTIGGNLNVGAATLAPGFSPGAITIGGNLTLSPTSITLIELGGLAAGTQFDQITVTGTANLAGTLNVASWAGFLAASGNTFNFMNYGASTGSFSTVNIPGGWTLNLTALAGGLQLDAPAAAAAAAAASPLAGLPSSSLPTNGTQQSFDLLALLGDEVQANFTPLTPETAPDRRPRQCQ